MREVTFYGEFSGWWSYAHVCRELSRCLCSTPGLKLTLCDLATHGALETPAYHDAEAPDRVSEDLRGIIRTRIEAVSQGAYVRPFPTKIKGTALFFGKPEYLEALPQHERNVAFVVCDAPPPANWVAPLNTYAQLVLTPSAWSKRCLLEAGTRVPIEIVRHGVSRNFTPMQGAHDKVRFFCTSINGVRKGAPRLAEALDKVVAGGSLNPCDIVIHSASHLVRELFLARSYGDEIDIDVEPVGSPEKMAALMAETRLVVAPSVAEGFGLIPLEAAVCGVPSVTTRGHGSDEYLPQPLIVTDDNLARSIEWALHFPQDYSVRSAIQVRESWAWYRILREDRFVDLLFA